MLQIIQRAKKPLLDPDEWSTVHPILQGIYAARGVQTKAEIDYQLQHLLPYEGLKNIEAAAVLLTQALEQQWRILVIGDFDADGATSSALAVRALRAFGAHHVDYLVPNRFTYGYGLTPGIVALAARNRPQLIITVDNGISSIDGVIAANTLGIKVLITDHHIPGDTLPPAASIVNPNQPGDGFASKNLAGVGVIFYVLLALRRALCARNYFAERQLVMPNMANYLDLVALGTVADLVPLDRNNRILVAQGVQRIRAQRACAGIKALLQVSKRDTRHVSAADLGFALAPRLNAAGRLDDMALGIDGLLTDELPCALAIAQQLDALNQQRRQIETQMADQAFTILKNLQLTSIPVGLCLLDLSWHQGVIGILASRIKDKYHRPVVIFAPVSDSELKGSARSVVGVHIRDVLEAIANKYPHLLCKFGGHAMAAGLSLATEHFPAFKAVFASEVALRLEVDALEGKVYSDGQLPSSAITLQLAQRIAAAGPWGQSFTEPRFDGIFTVLEQRLVGQQHLKLSLRQDKRQFSAIAFNVDLKLWPAPRCERIHAVYRIDSDHFADLSRLQLIIEHLAAC